MKKGRLEAFSDGVIAIIITIMVLELHTPIGDHLEALLPLWPVLVSYVLSFTNVGIYWNNHHHMLSAVTKISGTTLWLNLHFLFWLSLIPFTTEWMGVSHFSKWPVILYGTVLIMTGLAYTLLCGELIRQAGPRSALAEALGSDWKSKASLAIYAVALGVAFLNSRVSLGLYIVVACMWFIPDRRIEKVVSDIKGSDED